MKQRTEKERQFSSWYIANWWCRFCAFCAVFPNAKLLVNAAHVASFSTYPSREANHIPSCHAGQSAKHEKSTWTAA